MHIHLLASYSKYSRLALEEADVPHRLEKYVHSERVKGLARDGRVATPFQERVWLRDMDNYK